MVRSDVEWGNGATVFSTVMKIYLCSGFFLECELEGVHAL